MLHLIGPWEFIFLNIFIAFIVLRRGPKPYVLKEQLNRRVITAKRLVWIYIGLTVFCALIGIRGGLDLRILVVIAFPIIPSAWYWYRIRQQYRQVANPIQCDNCGYDLRGTIKAGKATCPECGHVIAESPAESG